ncbi:hypothetical protein, partial [Acetobacter fabarum]|uniref:hypothetical protein n=1 Tax=Acetobacter fabarum TaxID=483199 RepID=UPI001C54CD67
MIDRLSTQNKTTQNRQAAVASSETYGDDRSLSTKQTFVTEATAVRQVSQGRHCIPSFANNPCP